MAREADPIVEPHVMTGDDRTPQPGRPSLIERRARRIVNARSVVVGLALTFVALAFVGAIVMRIADPDDFPSLGLAIWWALQTVTTVGYGDVVPTTAVGRVIGSIEMVIGISFIAFLTAGVTSTVIQRGSAQAQEVERAHDEHNAKTILDALVETRQAITELDARLDRIESKITTGQ
jgi:voltage-gated potassium channel